MALKIIGTAHAANQAVGRATQSFERAVKDNFLRRHPDFGTDQVKATMIELETVATKLDEVSSQLPKESGWPFSVVRKNSADSAEAARSMSQQLDEGAIADDFADQLARMRSVADNAIGHLANQ